MTDASQRDTTTSAPPSGSTAASETAALLDAGLAPPPASGRWTPPTPSQLVGAIPNVEIIELVGAGAMGAVYRARQTHLERIVALKLLAPERAAAPGFAERFAREARAMARLNHPHIVRLHDFGQAGSWHWLAMEFVDGATLRQVLATGKLSAAEALRLLPQLCDALAHAHAAGVVHRDLKPENILIDHQGRARIADFGLAKLAYRQDERGEARDSLTATGDILGTAHYMAPEQLAASEHVDHRADLYALGVIAYEMLTGALPVGRFDPPSRASGVGPGVDEVVFKSLERDPQRRYRDAGELRAALERAGQPQAVAKASADPPHTEPQGGTVDVGPIHVSPGRVRVGNAIDVGPEGVRVGGIRVDHSGVHRDHAPAPAGGDSSRLYRAGMVAVLGGGTFGVWLATEHLHALLIDPLAHLAAHRVEDLALLATPLIVTGGIALLARSLMPAVIVSAIAALLYLPWAWQQPSTTRMAMIVAVIWYTVCIGDFARLRNHMASLPRSERPLRLLVLVPLFAAALAAPALMLIAH